ncbi:MAG TPA: alpha/beta hydrolase, partial [Actinomycetota bacterium]|nr:alpha/beta hydrolase [Actinomycetota bacterium]
AVVAISAPARWTGHDQKAWKRLLWLIESTRGRAIAGRLGYRLADAWDDPETPEAVIGRIAPTPVVLVHGEDDRVFRLDEARRLYEAASEPKRLMIAKRFGHAEDGLRPRFAERIGERLLALLADARAAEDTA